MFYELDKDNIPVRVGYQTGPKNLLDDTDHLGVNVSTSFIPNLAFGPTFETMVFGQSNAGQESSFQRHDTYEEAVRAHEKMRKQYLAPTTIDVMEDICTKD